MRMRSWLALLPIFTALDAAAAQPTTASPVVESRTQTSTDAMHDERQAKEWGLRTEEWIRYRELMRGPLGVYSPNLDPLTALGIEAGSETERARYAQLQARAEARRVDKILAYQRAYDAAWQRLFPNQPRFALSDARPAASASADTGRLAVFVSAGCPPCVARVQQLQRAGTAFDLYLVGSGRDDALLRRWAMQTGIDPERVRRRTITLNHDNGRWLRLNIPGALPAVLKEENGQWRREP